MSETIDETGFDAELRALAAKLYDEEAIPDSIFGREWREHDLFASMQAIAVTTHHRAKSDILAACEELGRDKARLYAAHAVRGLV